MKQNESLKRVWLTLYSITAILFLVIGVVMIVVDNNYFTGSQYVMTTIIFSTAFYLIAKGKVKPNYTNPMFNLGFIFSIIGLTRPLGPSLHIGLWALGIVLFLSGLFNSLDEGGEGYEQNP